VRILPQVTPTKQQLPIVAEDTAGVMVIRGAAGSGKTTTALMRLRQLCGKWLMRRTRLGLKPPVRVLVLTYNRTLEGYIEELARQQVDKNAALELQISTFAKFALDLVGPANVLQNVLKKSWLNTLIAGFGTDADFLRDEVDYILGRFDSDKLDDYVTARRDGRGTTPRMEAARRTEFLDKVVRPYIAQKEAANVLDWNDVAELARNAGGDPWDVIVVDEAQDFSVKEIRAIMSHLAKTHSVTFVVDAAQRIYPRSFTWREADVDVRPENVKTLTENYRNTSEIAAFARPFVEGVPIGADGALPDLNATSTHGDVPTVIAGKYSDQVQWAIDNVIANANLADESVAFLQVYGSGYFAYLDGVLDKAKIPHVFLQRNDTWPGGTETVALSTLHSAKGLEFDHVIILGLNQEVTPHGDDEDDAQLANLRRLLAMGVGRARKSVTLGYKPGEASTLIGLLKPGTYKEVKL
jgi:superfamily I DNA/RNA helicase